MNQDGFNEGYDEGRMETRSELNNIAKGEGISTAYSQKMAKKSLTLQLIVWVGGCIFLLTQGWNFFLALITSFGIAILSTLIFSLTWLGLMMLIAKSRK